ncbi:MAG: sugar-binding protein [Treponema sp.]|jgi:putative multiple sugar transport system substrate-binding protein|nr:sugar-binding protein [Treponema sp.]
MKKLLAVLLALSMVAGGLFAAGGSEGKGLIGIAMPETHVQRWQKDGNTLKQQAEKRGYRALVQWADANQLIQNGQIESYLLQEAQLLIIGCVSDGVTAQVANARRQGVPVIAYDRIISNSADYDYFITFNNFNVGEVQGRAIAQALNLDAATSAAPKRIALFAGAPTDGNAFFFFDGAMSILNPYIDKGVLVIVGPAPRQSSDRTNFQRITTELWQASVAKTRMENLLNGDARNVTLDAVLAPNDPIARAIIEALRADAKYRTTLPIVTGQDAEIASMASIRDGGQYMTVFKDTAKLAEAAMILAEAILAGRTPNIPGTVIAESIGLGQIGDTGRKRVTTYLLQVTPVTRTDNFQAPFNANFYSDAEKRSAGF